MRPGHWPVASTSDMVVKAVGDELLVYDLVRHRAHSLNAVAASVWRACDGARDVDAIAAAAAAATGQPVPAEAVRFGLRELGRAHLMTGSIEPTGLTRRELMRRLGSAAVVALPLVTSVVAPTAAQAQSCIPEGAFICSTVTPPFCCSGLQCTQGGCQPEA